MTESHLVCFRQFYVRSSVRFSVQVFGSENYRKRFWNFSALCTSQPTNTSSTKSSNKYQYKPNKMYVFVLAGKFVFSPESVFAYLQSVSVRVRDRVSGQGLCQCSFMRNCTKLFRKNKYSRGVISVGRLVTFAQPVVISESRFS